MRTGDISSTTDFIFLFGDAGGGEEEGGGGWCAHVEGEGTVWADGYAGGDWGAGYEVGGSGIEFLVVGVR